MQWVAKLAAADRDYRDTLASMRRTPASDPAASAQEPTINPRSASTGRGWRTATAGHRTAATADLGLGLGSRSTTAVVALEPDDTDAWFLDALDLLMAHAPDGGDRAAEAVRGHLRERDQCAACPISFTLLSVAVPVERLRLPAAWQPPNTHLIICVGTASLLLDRYRRDVSKQLHCQYNMILVVLSQIIFCTS